MSRNNPSPPIVESQPQVETQAVVEASPVPVPEAKPVEVAVEPAAPVVSGKKRWSCTRNGTGLTKEIEADSLYDAIALFQDDTKDFCGPDKITCVEMPS